MKFTPTTLQGLQGAISPINDNFDKVAEELQDKVLYRNNPVGEPNQMENDIDMNSNDLLNVNKVDTKELSLNGNPIISLTGHEDTYDHDGYDNHVASTSNPHGVTASQVGSYTKAQADAEFSTGGNQDTHSSRTDNPHNVTKSQVGLGNVPNEDATDPTNWDYPLTGSDTNIVTGTAGSSGSLIEWNADGDAVDSGQSTTGVTSHIASTSNPHSVTKTQVGLGNVPNEDATDPANWDYGLTGADTTVVTGTAGTDGNLAEWNTDGDLVDSGVAAANVMTESRQNLLDRVNRDATLLLDFANNKYRIYEGLSDGNTEKTYANTLTHTRASAATGVDALGVIQTVTSGTQRLVYSPETGRAEGLLVEEERTNIVLDSSDFTTASWTDNSVTTSDSGTSSVISGDNWITIEATADANVFVDQTVSVNASTYSVFCYFEKKALSVYGWLFITGATVWIDLSNGSIQGQAGSPLDITITEFDNSYQLAFSVTYGSSGSSDLRVGIRDALTGETVNAVGAQVEEGESPTSYIKTGGTTVTRSADEVSQTEISKWFNENGVTILIKAKTLAYKDNQRFLYIDDGTTSNRFFLYSRFTEELTLLTESSGSVQPLLTTGVKPVADLELTCAIAYTSTTQTLSVNGTTVSDTLSGIPTGLTDVAIGSEPGGGNELNGTISYFEVLPYALSSAELTEFTSATETI